MGFTKEIPTPRPRCSVSVVRNVLDPDLQRHAASHPLPSRRAGKRPAYSFALLSPVVRNSAEDGQWRKNLRHRAVLR